MNPERFRQIDELFDAVLGLPEAEREAFLSAEANGDEDLRGAVLRLLKAQSGSSSFLEKSAMGLAAKRLADAQTVIAESEFLGKTIGTYKIEEMLGAGGMGEVYLASDAKLERRVALEILPAEFTSDDDRVKRFRLEARTISILNHPNIVTIFDVGTSAAGVNFIATEYVEGQNLRELSKVPAKIKDVLGTIIQACEALSVAHRAGIIHRDIKPENIMLRPDGYVKILDFGVAKLNAADSAAFGDLAKTSKGTVIGTPAYMSPEQVGGDAPVDHRTDLWSVGVCLYELLTGKNPFKKANRRETFQAILAEQPPLPSALNQEIVPELDRIVIKALEKNPDSGYQTAADLCADLQRVRREMDSDAPVWIPDSNQKPTARRRNYTLYVASLLLLPLLGFGIWYFIDRSKQTAAGSANEWTAAQNSQLTNSPWTEGYPSFSPDGKNIIFAAEIEGDSNIYLQRIGGKTLQNLTQNSKTSDSMPVFSPDGKLIAFRSQGEQRGIYVMEETGENARRISDFGFHPSWSPDGKKIVVSDKPSAIHTSHTVPNSRLWVIDPSSGEKQPLETGGDAVMPSWSPNGHRIAFWFINGGDLGEIATIPAGGGEPVMIASETAATDWNPVWSPDGKYLYFASNRKGNMNFWRVPIDERTGRQRGEPESVSTPSKYCRHLAISRDGKRLGYVRYESKSNLQTIAFDPKTLKIAGDVNWVTQGNIEISHPHLSPGGEDFLIRHPDNVQEDLAVFDKSGNNWRSLTKDSYHERYPRWSPDGKRIAFQTDRTGKYQIWMIDPDGSNLRQITYTEKSGAILPVFSPDGKRLIFTETDGGARRPFTLDLSIPWDQQTPQALPPLEPNFYASAIDWSKDGKKLLVDFHRAGGDENGVALFDFETSKYEKITETGSLPFWLNDNRHFIFSSRNAVYLGDILTKKINELYKPPAYELQHANISPDNRTIYFRYLQIDADIWIMNASPTE